MFELRPDRGLSLSAPDLGLAMPSARVSALVEAPFSSARSFPPTARGHCKNDLDLESRCTMTDPPNDHPGIETGPCRPTDRSLASDIDPSLTS